MSVCLHVRTMTCMWFSFITSPSLSFNIAMVNRNILNGGREKKLTQSTRSTSPNGFCPDKISSITTPKLNTSAFSPTRSAVAYSGAT